MDLSGKNVAVYGLGVTGLAVLEALQGIELKQLIIVNGSMPTQSELSGFQFNNIPKCYSEDIASEALSKVDLILLSPGIPRSKKTLELAHKNKVKIWNEIEWCSQGFDGEIIAITGTNGKTTTVTFLDLAFKKAGVSVFTGGNIGIPFSKIYHQRAQYDLTLLEMSSFQCESLESFKPSIAGYLNLFANHGERYESVEDYRLSKWALVSNQNLSDRVFFGPGAGPAPSYLKGEVEEMTESWPSELMFIDWTKVKLAGEHNRENIWFAWKIFSRYFEIKEKDIPLEIFMSCLYDFNGVEHRVESCPPFEGHLVFNDAKSTNWQATISALKAVIEKQRPVILIIGGKLRGLNDLPESLQRSFMEDKTIHILAIGEAASVLKNEWPEVINVETIKGAKDWFVESHETESCILFSPAFPSFDQFEDYADRGRQFKKEFSN